MLKLDFGEPKIVEPGLNRKCLSGLHVAISFNPNNEEIKDELSKMEEMCKTSCGKEPIENNGVSCEDVTRICTDAISRVVFDPLKIHHSPMLVEPSTSGCVY